LRTADMSPTYSIVILLWCGMAAQNVAPLAEARREVATVRMLLEELERLTGEAAEQVSRQLADELAVLGRRLLDASAAIGRGGASQRAPDGASARPVGA
jgi:hypothetical protein